MTKYVVNSGGVMSSGRAKEFFDEILKGLGQTPKLLLCNFAIPREDWEVSFEEEKKELSQVLGNGAKPEFLLAMPDEFEAQLKECDAVYIQGGDDKLLQYWLKQYDLPRAWEGKVVATNSASSDAVSAQFWTCDWRKCMDGLAILPIKFLPHYKSEYGKNDPRGPIDWERGLKELEEYGDKSLPIYALKEGEFKVFEQ